MRLRARLTVAGLVLLVVAMAGGSRSADPATRAAGKSRAVSSRAARAAAKAPESVLVRVGGAAITWADVQRRLDELPEPYRANYTSPEGRQQFLDRLIEERVWLLGARKRGLGERPEVRRQIEQAERDLLVRTHVNEIMAGNPAPSDSEARVYYEAHTADYKVPATVTLSHILLKSESEARRMRDQARQGKDWKALVARYSLDTLTRKTGGALGTVTREGNFAAIGSQPALAESAFALGSAAGPGAFGGPWKTGRGWHVVKVDAVKPEGTRPYDQVKSLIVSQLGRARSQEYYRKRLAEEKASLGFSLDSAMIRQFVSRKKTAQELFREGQEAGTPAARIAAYRHLLEEYPDSEVSAQAQFMVGFIYSEELNDYEQAEQAFRDLLVRYPKSELVESARWMIANMRTEDAPKFMNLEADTSARATSAGEGRPSSKP